MSQTPQTLSVKQKVSCEAIFFFNFAFHVDQNFMNIFLAEIARYLDIRRSVREKIILHKTHGGGWGFQYFMI